MLEFLGPLNNILSGLQPLGATAGWVIGAGILLVYMNNTRFGQKKAQQEYSDRQVEDLQGDYDRERHRRAHAEQRGDRWRGAAWWWRATAHDERVGRNADRLESQQHYALLVGPSDLFKFPALMPMPRMIEEEDEKDGSF